MRGTVAEVTRQLQAVRLATGNADHSSPLAYPASDFFEDLRERFDRQHPDGGTDTMGNCRREGSLVNVDPELTMVALLELMGNALLYAVGKSPSGCTTCSTTGSDSSDFLHPRTLSRPPRHSPEWVGAYAAALRGATVTASEFVPCVAHHREAPGGTLRFAYSEVDKNALVTTVSHARVNAGDDEPVLS